MTWGKAQRTPAGPCSVEGCTTHAKARGLCDRHYKQARKADPTFVQQRRGTPSERFWRKVTVAGPDDCWRWTAATDPDGYGLYSIDAGQQTRAHRFAYAETHGPIPAGMVLDHDCHNRDPQCPGGHGCTHRLCVNPAHLREATVTANVFSSDRTRAARNAAKDYCLNGHPLFGDNLYVQPSTGGRNCRQCRADRKRRYRAEVRAARDTANQQRPNTPAA